MRSFNVTGSCDPRLHYMVDIQGKLDKIKKMIDAGAYFTINRARQYGKTTTLDALAEYIKKDYIVISLDFQMMSNNDFINEITFSNSFMEIFLEGLKENEKVDKYFPNHIIEKVEEDFLEQKITGLRILFMYLRKICKGSKKPIVMMIDEVDSATNNQVFLDFLAQIRAYYLKRKKVPTFQSVILVGVYDVKSVKRKVRLGEEQRVNSPWNIAADFLIDMNFSKSEIESMLKEYEKEHHTGMDTELIAGLIHNYTSGYPFLVSRVCKLMDEEMVRKVNFLDKKNVWTQEGFFDAVKTLLLEKNPLFESIMGKLHEYPSLSKKLYLILFGGKKLLYNPDDVGVDIALIFGLVKNDKGTLAIANRIFATRLYNYFLTTDETQNIEIAAGDSEGQSQFLHNNHVDMELTLKKFMEHFDHVS